MNKIGPWSYMIGLVVAIFAGLAIAPGAPEVSTVIIGLGGLGLLVGLLNVSDKEVMLFLVAAIAFLLSAKSLADLFSTVLGEKTTMVFGYLVAFTAPAAAIVAIKALYEISNDK
jgi:hypothetical protein